MLKTFDNQNLTFNRSDFVYMRTDAKKIQKEFLIAYYRPSRISITKTRLAFSISKQVGNAVRRNRVRRILKEFFRRSDYQEKAVDILFVVSYKLFKSGLDINESEKRLLKSFEKILMEIK